MGTFSEHFIWWCLQIWGLELEFNGTTTDRSPTTDRSITKDVSTTTDRSPNTDRNATTDRSRN